MVLLVSRHQSPRFRALEAAGREPFCSRHNWGRQVAYASQFEGRDDRAWRGKRKINARLAVERDPDDWDLPPKPEWMRWRTYQRYVDKYEHPVAEFSRTEWRRVDAEALLHQTPDLIVCVDHIPDDPAKHADALDVLMNTYWVRFDKPPHFTFAQASRSDFSSSSGSEKRLDGFPKRIGTVGRIRERDHLVPQVEQPPGHVLT
jgi:hypothetical protein